MLKHFFFKKKNTLNYSQHKTDRLLIRFSFLDASLLKNISALFFLKNRKKSFQKNIWNLVYQDIQSSNKPCLFYWVIVKLKNLKK